MRKQILSNISAPTFTNKIEVLNGFNSDIIDVIHYNLPRAARQVREISKFFKGADDLQTSRKIWDFLKKEIKYKRDPEGQQDIRLPGRFVAEAVGDCKSYSLFTGAILTNLNIPFSFRYTSYSSDPTPQHIYVVTDSGIIIDGVWNSFNSEKKYTHKKDYPMKIQTLSGIGCTDCRNTSATSSVMIGSIGKINLKKAASNVKKAASNIQNKAKSTAVVKKSAQIQTKAKNTGIVKAAAKVQNQIKAGGFKAVIGAAPRRAYRTLVALNWRGWANKLASNINAAKSIWAKAGGSWPELEKSILIGKNKKALFGSKTQKVKTVDGIGDVTLATVGSILALAAPIIALFKNMTGDDEGAVTTPGENAGDPSTGDSLTDIVDNITNIFTGKQKTDNASGQNQNTTTTETPTTEKGSSSSSSTNLLMLGALGLTAYFIFK